MHQLLSEQASFDRVSNAVAAGTSTVNSAGFDSAGFEGVLFLVAFGTLTVAPTLKAQQSSDDAIADAYADLEGSALAPVDADDNKLAIVDIRRPNERYVRLAIDRSGGNAVIDSITAIGYGASEQPVTQGSDVSATGHAKLLGPIEGTA